MGNILIIDDDNMLCNTLCRYIRNMGHDVTYALTLEGGLKEVSSTAFDVVFLDIRLPDGNGLDALPRVRNAFSSPEVIIITGEGDPDGAELAIKTGAWAYIEKRYRDRERFQACVSHKSRLGKHGRNRAVPQGPFLSTSVGDN